MKRITLISVIFVFAVSAVFLAYSPFQGTQMEKSAKLNSWWNEVVKTKYYTVDFSQFTFRDIKELKRRKYKSDWQEAQKLLLRIPRSERSYNWLAVYDNRKHFCGLLSENKIIANAGTKGSQGKEVYLNMFLNTKHLPSAHYLVDNISYYTDNLGRIVRVYCPDLQLKPRGRNQKSQRYSVSFKDGKKGDNCGHLIPQALYGPAEQINYVPQRRELNSGSILELEKKAINAKRAGRLVKYDIKILYHKNEKRPYGFESSVKAYDNTGKLIANYTGVFDNSIHK